MLGNSVLKLDDSFQPYDGSTESKPKARSHKDLAFDVSTGEWYMYYHKAYLINTSNYDEANWKGPF